MGRPLNDSELESLKWMYWRTSLREVLKALLKFAVMHHRLEDKETLTETLNTILGD